MKKLRLLLLDADIVIELFESELWDAVVERCEVLLARTVAEIEADHYSPAKDRSQPPYAIDLKPYADAGRIEIIDVAAPRVSEFIRRFDPTYLDRLDPGESESLAYLVNASEEHRICSADKIVFIVLGRLRLSEQGISLEEILQQIGLTKDLSRQFTKAYREEWTRRGQQDRITDIGLAKS